MRPNSRAQHATRTNQWTISRYPSVTGHLAIISLIYISITDCSISWLLFTDMSSGSCTVVFINCMIQMLKSCSAPKKWELFSFLQVLNMKKKKKKKKKYLNSGTVSAFLNWYVSFLWLNTSWRKKDLHVLKHVFLGKTSYCRSYIISS